MYLKINIISFTLNISFDKPNGKRGSSKEQGWELQSWNFYSTRFTQSYLTTVPYNKKLLVGIPFLWPYKSKNKLAHDPVSPYIVHQLSALVLINYFRVSLLCSSPSSVILPFLWEVAKWRLPYAKGLQVSTRLACIDTCSIWIWFRRFSFTKKHQAKWINQTNEFIK